MTCYDTASKIRTSAGPDLGVLPLAIDDQRALQVSDRLLMAVEHGVVVGDDLQLVRQLGVVVIVR
jgi:hypothetical protein